MGEPANLPGFEGLADEIAHGQSRQLKRVKIEDPEAGDSVNFYEDRPLYRLDESLDGFLGELDRRKIDVRERACGILKERQSTHNNLHSDLLRLFGEPSKIRVVTTNFDTLFEKAALARYGIPKTKGTESYQVKGGYLYGIYHVHGDWDDPSNVVITDSDFAKGYINPGTIRQYLLGLFSQFSVLFVGYSLSDTLMRYLSMAIDVTAKPRYVLTDNPDPNRWDMFSMTPIGYAESPNHSALTQGVHDLADWVEWSNPDWEIAVSRIALSGVPKSKEEEDLVKQALRVQTRARIFRDNATSPEWIAWLDKWGYLGRLFENEEFNWLQSTLSYWIAHSHSLQHPNEVFELISKYPGPMNPRLWADIVQAISDSRNADIPTAVLRRWVSVLVARSPGYINEHFAIGLIKTTLKHDDATDEALTILDHVIEARVIDKVPHPANSRRSTYLRDVGLAWALRMIWAELSHRIDAVAEPLTKVTVRSILRQHEIAQTWREGNLHGPWVHEIEPIPTLTEKDPRSPGAVLIGIAANLLAWMATNRPTSAHAWVARLSETPVEILHRLAISTVPYLEWEPEAKIEWLLRNEFVADRNLLAEAQILAQNAFLGCDGAVRAKLVTTIVSGTPEPRGCKCDASMPDDRQFDWLSKLRFVDPTCQVVAQALEPLQESHPEWDTDAFVERAPVSIAAFRPRVVPLLSVDELLLKSISDAVDDLLACATEVQETNDGGDVVRKSVVRTIFEASSKHIDWGVQLASELSRRGIKRHDMWEQLLLVWGAYDLDDSQFEAVVEEIIASELVCDHGRLIATMLRSRIEHRQDPYPTDLTVKCKRLAMAVWGSATDATVPDYRSDWWTEAWQTSAGDLTNFWVKSLWLDSKTEHDVSTGFYSVDREFLDSVVSDVSVRGLFGQAILGSYSATLFTIDAEWTKANLVPLFEVGNESSAAVWDGLAGSKTLTPQLAQLMQPLFLQAALCLRDDRYWARDDVRRGFISKFVIEMMFRVIDPVTAWLPAFFDNSTEGDRAEFAMQIGQILEKADDFQRTEWWERWLKTYWQNRLEGVPAQLTSKEVGMMLQWPKHLTPVFDDAVEFAIRMPAARPEDMFVSHLIDADLAKAHPNGVAQLLEFVDQEIQPDSWAWYNVGPIIEALQASDLDEGTKARLSTIQERYGMDATT